MANALIDAIEWQDPNASLAGWVGRPHGVPDEVTAGANAERIWVSEAKLKGFDDPEDPVSAQGDCVAGLPGRHRALERGRVGGAPVFLLELVREGCHSVLPFVGWDRTCAESAGTSASV